jgi:hypothetical protein
MSTSPDPASQRVLAQARTLIATLEYGRDLGAIRAHLHLLARAVWALDNQPERALREPEGWFPPGTPLPPP